MTPATNSQLEQTDRLDRSMEYAAVQSWDELMPDPASGQIHFEYRIGCDGSLDFVKVWASVSRGQWKLVCEMWMRSLWSHSAGLFFSNGYQPVTFAHAMKFLMEHEGAFSMLPSQNRLPSGLPANTGGAGRSSRMDGANLWRLTESLPGNMSQPEVQPRQALNTMNRRMEDAGLRP